MYLRSSANACEEEEPDSLEEQHDCFGARYNVRSEETREGSYSLCAPSSYSGVGDHSQYFPLEENIYKGDPGLVEYAQTNIEGHSPPFSVQQETSSKRLKGDHLRDCCYTAAIGHWNPCYTTTDIPYFATQDSAYVSRKDEIQTAEIGAENGKDQMAAKLIKQYYSGVSHGLTGKMNMVWKPYQICRPSGSKDRHSKVITSRGPRDRRMRLSVETAIKFFDVQDRLGYDQPSKAVEWLIQKSHYAIAELQQMSPLTHGLEHPSTGCLSTFRVGEPCPTPVNNPNSNSGEFLWNLEEEVGVGSCSTDLSSKPSVDAQQFSPGRTGRRKRNSSNEITGSSIQNSPCLDQERNSGYSASRRKEASAVTESRAKARERARERTKEKGSTYQSVKTAFRLHSPHQLDRLSRQTDQYSAETIQFQENTTSGSSTDKLSIDLGLNGRQLSSILHAKDSTSNFGGMEAFQNSAFLNSPQFFSSQTSLRDLQSSAQTTVQCQQDQGSSIQSTGSFSGLNSTIFPLSSLNPDCPFSPQICSWNSLPIYMPLQRDYYVRDAIWKAHISTLNPMYLLQFRDTPNLPERDGHKILVVDRSHMVFSGSLVVHLKDSINLSNYEALFSQLYERCPEIDC
eukprot:Gb_30049 [translate_table: standard]